MNSKSEIQEKQAASKSQDKKKNISEEEKEEKKQPVNQEIDKGQRERIEELIKKQAEIICRQLIEEKDKEIFELKARENETLKLQEELAKDREQLDAQVMRHLEKVNKLEVFRRTLPNLKKIMMELKEDALKYKKKLQNEHNKDFEDEFREKLWDMYDKMVSEITFYKKKSEDQEKKIASLEGEKLKLNQKFSKFKEICTKQQNQVKELEKINDLNKKEISSTIQEFKKNFQDIMIITEKEKEKMMFLEQQLHDLQNLRVDPSIFSVEKLQLQQQVKALQDQVSKDLKQIDEKDKQIQVLKTENLAKEKAIDNMQERRNEIEQKEHILNEEILKLVKIEMELMKQKQELEKRDQEFKSLKQGSRERLIGDIQSFSLGSSINQQT